ncbi:S26 family signal peptidase [Micromonospora sp. NPDC048170]|uniref:S26 family signal peptidase n=1 Tax=Micromonospora sp. NPDC048170 TaxID=3154819 RepID=UPI00340BC211
MNGQPSAGTSHVGSSVSVRVLRGSAALNPARPTDAVVRVLAKGRNMRLLSVLSLALSIPVGWAAVALELGAWPWALVVASTVLIGLCLSASVVLSRRLIAVTVSGRSMEPSYHNGDRVLVRRGVAPAVGQVVVVEQQMGNAWPSNSFQPADGSAPVAGRTWLIKRVAAVPGDPVPFGAMPVRAEVGQERVPPGMLVLLGDNQAESFDSRRVGYFPTERLLGIVLRALPR